MTEDEAWATERAFWTGDADHCRDAIDPACVMAFPAPAGIVAGADILASLAGAPRWASVAMTGTRLAEPAPGLRVLAYRAEARRDGGAAYVAWCTSTYRLADGRWRLIQHGQTPA